MLKNKISYTFKYSNIPIWICLFLLLALTAVIGFTSINRINAQDEVILKQEQRIQQLEKNELSQYQRRWVKQQSSNSYCSAYPDKCGE